MKIKSKMESIFKKGDRVFHSVYGWGDIIEINVDGHPKVYQVNFSKGKEPDAVLREYELSFTEYELKGFSHERPIDYNKWIGKYCIFLDGTADRFFIDRFKGYKSESEFKFTSEGGSDWENGKLLSEVVLEELGITNEKY